MFTLLTTLPEDLFLNQILQYLTAADLWRLGAVCQKFHTKELERNLIERELKARDDALLVSGQYPPQSPILSLLNYRQRVLCFERCREFAWKMTRETQQHECGFSCRDPDCQYPQLDNWMPTYGGHYFFFIQFTTRNNNKVLWQGFIEFYGLDPRSATPLEDLLRNNHHPDGPSNEVPTWKEEIQRNHLSLSDNFHLDIGNVSGVTREDVNADLHVTLVSLRYYANRPEIQPPLLLFYSSQGYEERYPRMSTTSSHYSPSVDVLCDQKVYQHRYKDSAHYTALLMWKSNVGLHSFSLLYKSRRQREPYYDDYGWHDDDSDDESVYNVDLDEDDNDDSDMDDSDDDGENDDSEDDEGDDDDSDMND